MSLTATGSLSSPGSMGTPMYRSRSDASSVWSLIGSLIGPRSRPAAGPLGPRSPSARSCPSVLQPCRDERQQLLVPHLGVAAGHRDLALAEEQHALGNLVGGDPLAQEALDLVLGGRGAVS